VIGPSFQWNVLNYGRILNGVRLQDAKFQEFLATYQNSVLTANEQTLMVGQLPSGIRSAQPEHGWS